MRVLHLSSHGSRKSLPKRMRKAIMPANVMLCQVGEFDFFSASERVGRDRKGLPSLFNSACPDRYMK